MQIRNEFRIDFELPAPTPVVAMLHLHPSLRASVQQGDILRAVIHSEGQEQELPYEIYQDSFGNQCTRLNVPAGLLSLTSHSVVTLTDETDPQPEGLAQHPVEDLPAEVLQFLLSSRYCEVDTFSGIAQDLFGHMPADWQRAAAIRDWVHSKVHFDYSKARATKTAMDVFTERAGVCRDFQHLAVTLSRALNIPARYVTGYLGDIRVPYAGPGDFSAWYQVYMGGRWWNMDGRHNEPRYGRVLMAAGRDAADVAITTSFGEAGLKHFWVESNEVDAEGKLVPIAGRPAGTGSLHAVPPRAA